VVICGGGIAAIQVYTGASAHVPRAFEVTACNPTEPRSGLSG